MPHTVTVNLPNLPKGELVQVDTLCQCPNGESVSVPDEVVEVWKIQNPGRELPTVLDHREQEDQRLDALAARDVDEAILAQAAPEVDEDVMYG